MTKDADDTFLLVLNPEQLGEFLAWVRQHDPDLHRHTPHVHTVLDDGPATGWMALTVSPARREVIGQFLASQGWRGHRAGYCKESGLPIEMVVPAVSAGFTPTKFPAVPIAAYRREVGLSERQGR